MIVNRDLNNSFQFHLHLVKESSKLIRISPYSGKEEAFGGEMDWLAPGAGILLRIEEYSSKKGYTRRRFGVC